MCICLFRGLVLSHFCQGIAFWNVFAWLPMYFEEHYPGSKVSLRCFTVISPPRHFAPVTLHPK